MPNIIFDFDGTIVDSRTLIVDIYNEIARRDGYNEIKRSDIENLSNYSIPDRCKMLGVPMFRIPGMLIEVRKKYKKHVSTLLIKDGVLDLLHRLDKKGLELGIISSNSVEIISQFLKGNQLGMIKCIYSAKSLFGKHHVINGYIKKFNIDKKDVMYVGDEVRDIEACKKSGVPIIAVSWGYDSKELLKKGNPEYLVDCPVEVMHIFSD